MKRISLINVIITAGECSEEHGAFLLFSESLDLTAHVETLLSVFFSTDCRSLVYYQCVVVVSLVSC